ncbi:MAG: hypothetical protein Q8J85_07120 [Sulfuricurvum sp.]|nr:hypothetical protein [Sulfuricurvum sp.]MDP3023003.1 hypothetical protein [Sulfuricurvum sp.]
MSKDIIVSISSRQNLKVKQTYFSNGKIQAFDVGVFCSGKIIFETKPQGMVFKRPIEVELDYHISFDINTKGGGVNLIDIEFDGYRIGKRLKQAEMTKTQLISAVLEKVSKDSSVLASAEMFGLYSMPTEDMIQEVKYYNQNTYKRIIETKLLSEEQKSHDIISSYLSEEQKKNPEISEQKRQVISKVESLLRNIQNSNDDDAQKVIMSIPITQYRYFSEEDMNELIESNRTVILTDVDTTRSMVREVLLDFGIELSDW